MTIQLVALSAAFVMLIGGGFLVYRRTTGLGPSTLQAVGLVLLVPSILILAVTNALSTKILATLLGDVAGYVLGRNAGGDGAGRN